MMYTLQFTQYAGFRPVAFVVTKESEDIANKNVKMKM
jgi:hypothetical protein